MRKVITAIGTVSTMFLILWFAVCIFGLSPKAFMPYYTEEIVAETGVEKAELDRLITEAFDFLGGRLDSMQTEVVRDGVLQKAYNDDELSHMQDVKNVLIGFWVAALVAAIGVTVFVVSLIRSRKEKTNDVRTVVITLIVIAAVAAGIAALAIFAFDFAFTLFHKVFFPQGNWMFPWHCLIVNIYPEAAFNAIAIKIILSVLFVTGGLLAALIFWEREKS